MRGGSKEMHLNWEGDTRNEMGMPLNAYFPHQNPQIELIESPACYRLQSIPQEIP